MPQDNAFQISDWNGPTGARWLAHQQRLDRMLDGFGEAAIEAARPTAGEQVLDIGCGAGATSLVLADHVGAGGQVLGMDISEGLIGRAMDRAPAGVPVAFRVEDAARAALPQTFDLLFSRFGVMFFDDPVAAFSNMRRALKPGGRLVFVCWRSVAENDWVRLPMGVVRDIVPPPAPVDPEAPGPFSFADRGRVSRILTAAGFSDPAFTAFDRDIPFGQGVDGDAAIEDALDLAFEVGPLSRLLADQPDDIRARASAAVRAAFARRLKGNTVVIDGAAWIVTADRGAG